MGGIDIWMDVLFAAAILGIPSKHVLSTKAAIKEAGVASIG